MDDYVIDGDLVFSDQSSALKFYREQYHKKKEWQGLTDEELSEVLGGDIYDENSGLLTFARAIESKLKEKNNG